EGPGLGRRDLRDQRREDPLVEERIGAGEEVDRRDVAAEDPGLQVFHCCSPIRCGSALRLARLRLARSRVLPRLRSYGLAWPFTTRSISFPAMDSIVVRADRAIVEGEARGATAIRIEDGAIVEVADVLDPRGARVVDWSGRAVVPGTVNAHNHSFQSLLRGF